MTWILSIGMMTSKEFQQNNVKLDSPMNIELNYICSHTYLLTVIALKKSGKCPKCGSTRIWNPGNRKVFGVGYGVWFKISTWRSARLIPYVCLDCSYSELNCDDEGIEAIEKYATKKLEISYEKKCPICGTMALQNAQVCDECGSVLD